MLRADRWKDYEVLLAGSGEKTERWGDIVLRRPDPQVIWPCPETADDALRPHAVYHRSDAGGGTWEKTQRLPGKWKISYPLRERPLTFWIEPTGFKHTGLFPEQAVNWDFCASKIHDSRRSDLRILNLFAYTGGATLAAAAGGAAEVVHVDASKGMIARAKENVVASGLEDKYIRFIAEDCNRFVEREIRRGRTYHGIIMDPPAYGRGPAGELWKLEDALYDLVEKCARLLDQDALFFLINSYTTGLSPLVMENILRLQLSESHGGQVTADELGLPIHRMGITLPCGAVARWFKGDNPR